MSFNSSQPDPTLKPRDIGKAFRKRVDQDQQDRPKVSPKPEPLKDFVIPSELGRIEAADFIEIADNHHPVLWKNIAQSLARRLRERNERERVKNLIPRIFIASSSESKEIIDCVAQQLPNDSVELIPWTCPGLFKPSTHTIDTLEKNAKEVDFAIILITPDDMI